MKSLISFLLLSSLAFAPSLSAQGFWDPPGEDPCDNPVNPPCTYGEDAYPGDAIGGAATAVGRTTKEYAETDLAWGFIFWLSENFGPKVPKEPKDDPKDDPKNDPKNDPKDDDEKDDDKSSSKAQTSSSNSSSAPLRTGVWVKQGQRFNADVRAYFDKYKEGQRIQTGAKVPAGHQVRYTLTYKREDLKNDKQEYDLTVKMTVRKANGQVYSQPIHILAEPGKVYFDSPKRKR